MESQHIDLIAVLLATVISFVSSWLWYSRWLFGELWMQLSNGLMEKKISSVFWSFVVTYISAYVLAFLESLMSVTTVSDGMFVGFLVWLGFVTTTHLSGVIWAKTPFKLYLLETGCKLLTFLAMGGILGA